MKFHFFILFVICICVTSYADNNINQIINEQLAKRNAILKEIAENPAKQAAIIRLQKQSSQRTEKYKGVVKKIKKKRELELKKQYKKYDAESRGVNRAAIVFVSLGMPENLLEEILIEAEKYQIPVVIRGLVNNSFSDTAKVILEIAQKNEKNGKDKISGISINPLWFRQFDVNQVPAVVVTDTIDDCLVKLDEKECPKQVYDIVFGNITIKNALEIVVEKGEFAKEAKEFLVKNKG